MGSDCSRLGKSYDQIYLPADCFRQCHAGDRCFCGSRHRSRKWMYVERGGDGREYFHDPMDYMDGFMISGANGMGSGGLGGHAGGSLLPPGILQSPDNWRLKDFERLNQVLLEYWNRLRGQQMVMAPYLGGNGAGRGGPLMPSWTMGAPGMNFGDMMGAGCGMGASPLRRRGGRLGGGWTSDYGSWEDEMTQRMKRMEEIAKDYEDRVRGISDHLYGSTAECQEEMYRKRQQQMWQEFMQGQQTQNAMGMNGVGGMGGGMGGMNGLAQMMPMQGLAGGMNPMMAGMGGMGGMLNPLQMGALGGMGANPLMGGGGLDEDRPGRRRRLGSRRRNSMFQDDEDDDDDILPRRRFGRRRRGEFGDDDDDLFPEGQEEEEEEEAAEDTDHRAVHTAPTAL
ncbi:hypothetical protein KC360_g9101 [Hortaea werneckii]|nr:hypothetical protein KC325_g9126 [Hortaea werneckii]KAI6985286.1 hypothetical protein KC359_g9189 [Hortaea werneckii]KAI7140462.1 hypothetical protein KC344_g8705 [Hortaea werneckii]KAI7166595.1 hypothetical protein KC360_g9101 [Hortaea werneckii]